MLTHVDWLDCAGRIALSSSPTASWTSSQLNERWLIPIVPAPEPAESSTAFQRFNVCCVCVFSAFSPTDEPGQSPCCTKRTCCVVQRKKAQFHFHFQCQRFRCCLWEKHEHPNRFQTMVVWCRRCFSLWLFFSTRPKPSARWEFSHGGSGFLCSTKQHHLSVARVECFPNYSGNWKPGKEEDTPTVTFRVT